MNKKINTAMILAAGRGERMRPLTDTLPKPLLEVHGKPLIEYHLERLATAGIKRVVINHAWLGDKIVQRLGDGSRFNVEIVYSKEETALETAGGIKQALPLLSQGDASDAFLVVNGDVFTDFSFVNMLNKFSEKSALVDNELPLAHLILVPNPPHNPDGDFYLQGSRVSKVLSQGSVDETPNSDGHWGKYTFSGIGVYRKALFDSLTPTSLRLAPVLVDAMANELVSGTLFDGLWIDIGTPERLAQLNAQD
ncbi:nucleotidyl transferase [Paraglaciecola mesophila KMM 241]|uniref:Nucleotidyl transferase n=1 Tax=Paraglaciecola mesophila KMM 241 TaxID=1128912 RepID=K6ZSF3_9ALTE|nr:nucleotidyltransferase family protein [Paraglaciecola mesophila]GAC26240.1 nucleotidyl transferase [Paraglaciecola mesophila KMM 241]